MWQFLRSTGKKSGTSRHVASTFWLQRLPGETRAERSTGARFSPSTALSRRGHISPLRAHDQHLIGNGDGTMLRGQQVRDYAERQGLLIGSVATLA